MRPDEKWADEWAECEKDYDDKKEACLLLAASRIAYEHAQNEVMRAERNLTEARARAEQALAHQERAWKLLTNAAVLRDLRRP